MRILNIVSPRLGTKNSSLIRHFTRILDPPRESYALNTANSTFARVRRASWSGPRHPGNIGAAARAMHTMGLAQLVLVAPRALSRCRGGRPRNRRDGDSCGRARGRPRFRRSARGLRAGRSAFPRGRARSRVACWRCATRRARRSDRRSEGDVALVFGTEMSGLSNAELAQCAVAATIPANPRYPSLNLAAAVQVAAYELRVAAAAPRCGARRASRARRTTRSRRCTRTRRRRWRRCAFWIPRMPEAPAAAVAPPVRPRRARAGGGQHPARDPRAHRSVRRPHAAALRGAGPDAEPPHSAHERGYAIRTYVRQSHRAASSR